MEFLKNNCNLVLFENFLRLLDETITGIYNLADIDLILADFNERIEIESIGNNEKNYLRLLVTKLEQKSKKQEHLLIESIEFYKNLIRNMFKTVYDLLKEELLKND